MATKRRVVLAGLAIIAIAYYYLLVATDTAKTMASDSTLSSIPTTMATPSAEVIVQNDSGKPSVIITDCNGHLGNQMSAYGTIYVLAETYGVLPMIRDDQAQKMCFFVNCEDAGIRWKI